MIYGSVFQSSGQHLGFTREDGYIFSRDGAYLGWLEEGFAWDTEGQFRGQVFDINGNRYILRNIYSVSPIPRTPKPAPPMAQVPPPLPAIPPIQLKIGFKDGF